MVIDTSALVAILLGEPEKAVFVEAILASSVRRCSSVTVLETSIVIESRRGADGLARLDLFVAEAAIEVMPFTLADARSARRAYRRYGKGRHPAGLNFGDCASYALAADYGEPLLYKGADFAKTEILAAVM